MTVSTNTYNLAGNQITANGVTITYDAMTNVAIPAATQPSVLAGTGTPTFAAPKGTLYIRLNATAATDRLWINADSSTTWHHIPAAG